MELLWGNYDIADWLMCTGSTPLLITGGSILDKQMAGNISR